MRKLSIFLALSFLFTLSACADTEPPMETTVTSLSEVTVPQLTTVPDTTVPITNPLPLETIVSEDLDQIDEYQDALTIAYSDDNPISAVSKVIYDYFTNALMRSNHVMVAYLVSTRDDVDIDGLTYQFMKDVKITSIDLVDELLLEEQMLTTYTIVIHV